MKLILFDTLPSTNNHAKENINSLNNNDIIAAKTQTAGRGRKERVWHSEKGGLYFSLVLKPKNINFDILPSLTQIMALSVCRALKTLGADACLKWPNDVLIHGKKVCGILSETVFEKDILKGIIVGVGLNISQAHIESEKPAITLNQLGIEAEREALLRDIFEIFENLYNRLIKDGFNVIRADYKAAFPYLGKQVTIRTEQKNITGTAQDIDGLGRLIIKTNGGTEAVSIGDMDF